MAEKDKQDVVGKSIAAILTGLNGSQVTSAAVSAPRRQPDTLVSVANRLSNMGKIANAQGAAMNAARTNASQIGAMQSFLQTSAQSTAARARNMRAMQAMAPEIKKAASILTPSILSPNDMGRHTIVVTCDSPDIDDESTRAEIGKIVSDHMEEVHSLTELVTRAIDETLISHGAFAVAVIPLTELYRKFDQGKAMESTNPVAALESFQTAALSEKESFFGISSAALRKRYATDKSAAIAGAAETAGVALESLVESLSALAKTAESGATRQTIRQALQRIATNKATEAANIAADIMGSVEVVDNPDVLRLATLSTKLAEANIGTKLRQMRYRYDPDPGGFSEIVTPTTTDTGSGNALLIDIPITSVRPIFQPGSPTKHVGYFILLDESNNPVDIDSYSDPTSSANGAGGLISQFPLGGSALFRAAGSNTYGMSTAMNPHRAAITDAYQRIMQNYLQDHLSAGGLSNVEHSTTDNSLYRAMFQRYLSEKRTRLLFIPRELLFYHAYDYDPDDGTGRTILHDAEHIISMRTTLMMARTMSALDNSINRRVIEYTMPEGWSGDETSYREQILRAVIDKTSTRLTWRPEMIQDNLMRRSFSIRNKSPGNMGGTSVDISHDAMSRNSTPPDQDLLQTTEDQLLSHLIVPASAMNALSQDEYSRTVAVTNILFGNWVRARQKPTNKWITRIVRCYYRYSETLKQDIARVLGMTAIAPSGSIESGNGAPNTQKVKLIIDRLEDYLTVNLPDPMTAPQKSQFESLREVSEVISNLATILYPDDMAGQDQDLAGILPTLRAYAASEIIRNYISTSGMGDMVILPDFDGAAAERLHELRQSLLNMKAGIRDQTIALTGKTPDGSDPEDNAGGGFGGGDGYGGGGFGNDAGGASAGGNPFGDDGGGADAAADGGGDAEGDGGNPFT